MNKFLKSFVPKFNRIFQHYGDSPVSAKEILRIWRWPHQSKDEYTYLQYLVIKLFFQAAEECQEDEIQLTASEIYHFEHDINYYVPFIRAITLELNLIGFYQIKLNWWMYLAKHPELSNVKTAHQVFCNTWFSGKKWCKEIQQEGFSSSLKRMYTDMLVGGLLIYSFERLPFSKDLPTENFLCGTYLSSLKMEVTGEFNPDAMTEFQKTHDLERLALKQEFRERKDILSTFQILKEMYLKTKKILIRSPSHSDMAMTTNLFNKWHFPFQRETFRRLIRGTKLLLDLDADPAIRFSLDPSDLEIISNNLSDD